MKFAATQLPDVVVIEPVVHEDERGFFMETWRENTFREAGIDASFVQDNHSRSSFGGLRGLHYQVRQPQGKLVRVIQGEVFDVAVDLRRSSPTFGRWAGDVSSVSGHGSRGVDAIARGSQVVCSHRRHRSLLDAQPGLSAVIGCKQP